MSRIRIEGSKSHIARSMAALMTISIGVMLRRLIGRPLVREWSRDFEIGMLFWRGQFNHAFALPQIEAGRAYFDSLQTLTDEVYSVERIASPKGAPKGEWLVPSDIRSPATLLHFHGGGYTFYAQVTRRFNETLAALLGARLFELDYRKTPEHPHPAQIEDALVAYRYLLSEGVDPRRIVISGDSAGGHLALMTLVALREHGLPQPALAIGICPWTDTGLRGASQFGNDRYDLVQGYMTLQFAKWLKGPGDWSDAQLSPIAQDYRGLAPIYLQGGGKEILIDMIRDFARVVRDQGVDVVLDVWEHMTHEFQANGRTLPESAEAIDRMAEAIRLRVEEGADLTVCARTEIAKEISRSAWPVSPTAGSSR